MVTENVVHRITAAAATHMRLLREPDAECALPCRSCNVDMEQTRCSVHSLDVIVPLLCATSTRVQTRVTDLPSELRPSYIDRAERHASIYTVSHAPIPIRTHAGNPPHTCDDRSCMPPPKHVWQLCFTANAAPSPSNIRRYVKETCCQQTLPRASSPANLIMHGQGHKVSSWQHTHHPHPKVQGGGELALPGQRTVRCSHEHHHVTHRGICTSPAALFQRHVMPARQCRTASAAQVHALAHMSQK
jgi:hypothetical protein